MNKFICFAFVIFAAIAAGSCSGYNLGSNGGYNLGSLGLNSYGNPSSSSSSASASSADGQNLGLGNYANLGLGNYNAPAASYGSAPRSYGAPKYTVQNAYATQLYPGQQSYKQYNSPATYSQVALPIIPDAPLAKLYAPAKSYGNYGSSY